MKKLEKTPVDGFSFWSDENPAIALTLRHSRIDNFAFTIMHEIAHIDLHLMQNKEKQFLDLEKDNVQDSFESEANSYAQKKLIPVKCWEYIKSRFPATDEDIYEISKNYSIHPAIILGRISFETNSYGLKTRIDKKLK
ncbi:MAG: ImmA/IrrE family metallo-endopeptidase [Candidatus Kapaibacterium sp.]